MRIIKTVEYELEPGDKELIYEKGPEDPCAKCSMGMACCGCPEGAVYAKFRNKLKQHNVLELHEKYHRYLALCDEFARIRNEISKLCSELSQFGLK